MSKRSADGEPEVQSSPPKRARLEDPRVRPNQRVQARQMALGLSNDASSVRHATHVRTVATPCEGEAVVAALTAVINTLVELGPGRHQPITSIQTSSVPVFVTSTRGGLLRTD